MKHGLAILFLSVAPWIHADDGAAIYEKHCTRCHGKQGEGVKGEHEEELYGDKSIATLARIIHKTMPEDAPKKVRESKADAVAAYIHGAFYSPEARARLYPAKIEFSRLTAVQFEQSVADLAARFTGQPKWDGRRGLQAAYFNSRTADSKKKVLDRIDPKVQFDFGGGSPHEKIKPEAFHINWTGSILAEESGEYEISVVSENGFRLHLNQPDNDNALIDGYVATRKREARRGTIRLIGGRAYPFHLEWFKFKDKTASVELRWKPPGRAERVIPQRNLIPDKVTASLVLSAGFPPDDSSVGYPRGTSVSKAWDEAATRAAIEAATRIVLHVDGLAKTKPDDGERVEKWKAFCRRFATLAFRRPLDDETRALYADRLFSTADDPETAVMRSVLLVLKSPRFLYPDLRGGDGHAVAARLALGLWDSVPDQALADAAEGDRLKTREQVLAQARRMLDDPRARAKLRRFFHHWLHLDEHEAPGKDQALFPGFDEHTRDDLRMSLDLFLEDIVWKGDGDFRKLLLADWMYLNPRLAEFYGVETEGEGFRKVSFKDQRFGIVTHPYLLSTFAYRNASSPIHRGVFLTRNMMGRSLKPPPEAQEFPEGKFDPNMTMREKVTELTKSDHCQSCHAVINALGFTLEHFDAVGRYREAERERPIHAASTYETREGRSLNLEGARGLAELAAGSASAQQGFVIQLFNQVAKQPVQAYPEGSLTELHRRFADSGFNVRELMIEAAVRYAMHARDSK